MNEPKTGFEMLKEKVDFLHFHLQHQQEDDVQWCKETVEAFNSLASIWLGCHLLFKCGEDMAKVEAGLRQFAQTLGVPCDEVLADFRLKKRDWPGQTPEAFSA